VLLTDNGTSYAIFGFRLPPKCTVLASIMWGGIGYSVGALLGTLTAAPERRHLLFIGDGSFQESAQELSTILRHDHKPVIFLINNGGYTIERGYMGQDLGLQRHCALGLRRAAKGVPSGHHSAVVRGQHCRRSGKALAAPNDSLIFVGSVMDPYDAPAPVIRSSNAGQSSTTDPAARSTAATPSSGQPTKGRWLPGLPAASVKRSSGQISSARRERKGRLINYPPYP
jgi:indolepyruvate decarboxylase